MRDAVHDVAALGPMLATHLARRAPAREPRLSPREREVLAALEEGLRFKQIALALGISQATAKTHGRHLFRKLDVTSRAEAVHAARTLGLL
jgi:DNA-binding CsgD family transcriptional regulator